MTVNNTDQSPADQGTVRSAVEGNLEMHPGLTIDAATPDDVPLLVTLIRELAEYERLLDEVRIVPSHAGTLLLAGAVASALLEAANAPARIGPLPILRGAEPKLSTAELEALRSWVAAKAAADPGSFTVALGPGTPVRLWLAGLVRPAGAPEYVDVEAGAAPR